MAAARSPCSKVVVRDQAAAAVSCVDANTTFVQADPATFRALVQKLTGAPPAATAAEKKPQRQEEAVTVAHAPPPRRPKLQERRRAALARLELARPHPAASPSFYYYHHHHHHGGGGGGGLMMHSPVSPMDAYVLNSLSPSSSMTPSPHSSSSCGVVISREEEEREEKAIASKGFYLHAASPRSAAGDADRPRLLPLFPLHSPRTSASSYAS